MQMGKFRKIIEKVFLAFHEAWAEHQNCLNFFRTNLHQIFIPIFEFLITLLGEDEGVREGKRERGVRIAIYI